MRNSKTANFTCAVSVIIIIVNTLRHINPNVTSYCSLSVHTRLSLSGFSPSTKWILKPVSKLFFLWPCLCHLPSFLRFQGDAFFISSVLFPPTLRLITNSYLMPRCDLFLPVIGCMLNLFFSPFSPHPSCSIHRVFATNRLLEERIQLQFHNALSSHNRCSHISVECLPASF